ncbi:hypothetical protein Tco_0673542 [Tanacetum coccineum]
MSNQQDIYAAGSENRPPMLKKENYVPWSSRLFRYAKSRPNRKLIYNSIMNSPYVKRMIPEPGDADHEVLVNETFHERDDMITHEKLKQVEADDQAIQTILLGLPKDIYVAVDSCETDQEIWQIAQPDMNLGQDRQMQMIGGNGGNQFRQYAGQNVRNQNGYNSVQNVGIRNGNVVAAQAEAAANLDEMMKSMQTSFLMANLQQCISNLHRYSTDHAPSKIQDDQLSQMTYKYFVEYTGIEVKHFRDTLLQHMGNVKKSIGERTRHQRQYDRRVNKRQMQTQEKVQDDISRSGNDTDANDADMRPIYDEEPIAEVQLTAECNIFAIGQQHTEQPEIINEGRVDQYPEQCQVKSPMLDSSPDNQTTEYSKQSLESENILLKKTVAQFQKDFSRMEAHCIALELKYQNQALKSGQHGQILNETSNIKKEIDVLKTMSIELEHNVAKLRKENETLKKHYKDLYDSIKITRSKTIEQTTSLLANNADLKAQIQEKVFAIAALKNDLRKLKGNSVDTKPPISKPWFASQVDVNKNLSKPVTQHYLPKKTESAFAKPDHMIASSSSRNSSKNMPRFSSNDMVHNHYLDVAKKKIQERDRNSTTSVTTSARIQTTADDSKPKPRSNNQTSRSLPVSKSSRVTITAVPKADHSKSSSSFSDYKQFVYSTCHKCVFNANHDACITKLLREVNSHAKIQSHKTRNSNKPIDQKNHTQKPGRKIFIGHKFSPNKTSAVYEKTSPRSDLRWKPKSRIVKSVGLRWIPTRKLFDSCTSKGDSEPPHGSNVDIHNIHECKQTLDVSAGTSINVQKEQSLDLSACTLCNVNKEDLRSSAIETVDASDKRSQQPDSNFTTSTLASSVSADRKLRP